MDKEKELIKKLLNDRNFEKIHSLIKLGDINIDEVINELLSSNDAEATYCFMKHEFSNLLLRDFWRRLDDKEIKDKKRLNLLMKRVVKLTGGKKELIKKLANNGGFTEIHEWIYRWDIYNECNISINEAFEVILSLDDAKTIYGFIKYVLDDLTDKDKKNQERRHLLIKRIIELIGGKKELIKKLLIARNFKEIYLLISTNEITMDETTEELLSLDDVKIIYNFMKYDEKAAKIHDLLIKKIIELKDYEYILKILADAITSDIKKSTTANTIMGDHYFFTALSRRDTKEGYEMLRQYSYAMQDKSYLNNYEESILNNLQLLLDALSDCDDLSLLKKYKEKVAMGSIKKYLEKLISKLSGVQHEEDNTLPAETDQHCKNVSEPSNKSYQPNKDTSKLPNKSDNESKSHYKIKESESHLSESQKYQQERYIEKMLSLGLTPYGYGLPLQGYSRNRKPSNNSRFGPMDTPYDIKRRKRKK